MAARGQALCQEQLHQHRQNDERQAQQNHTHHPSSTPANSSLLPHDTPQAFGKELATDHDIPAHGQNANQDHHGTGEVNPFSNQLGNALANQLQ